MLFIPIIVLLLAAGATWLVRNLPSRTQWAVSTSFGLIIWSLSLLMLAAVPNAARFSIWQPANLFQTPLEFTLDKTSWGLAYCISTVLLSMILTAATRPDIASTGVRAFWFVYAALAILAVSSINLLTVVLTFALIDLCSFVFFIYHTESVDDVRRAIVRAGVDLGGVLLIVSAAWVNSIDGIGAGLNVEYFSAPAAILLLMGVLLRLGLIPLPFALPTLSPLSRGAGTLLRLYPPALALSLLARFLENGAPVTIRIWLATAGAIGILVGGVSWLLEEDRVLARPFLVMGLAGVGILASSSASANGDVLFATSALLLLVGALLSLIQIHTPSHRLWPAFAAALLIGIPLSPGGLISSVMGRSVLNEGTWIRAIIGIIGLSSLSLGAIHIFFSDEEPWPTGESLIRVMYSMGLALPVLVSIGLGFWIEGTFSIYGGLVAAAAIALGAGVFLALRNLRGIETERWKSALLRLNPQRIYSVFWDILRRSLGTARTIGELFEGEAAMLWMFAFIAVLFLALR
ncbi:MAG: hypothetical protein MUO58_00335 [Anaerolineales bacterium]|nr:hypothetical protein [Anaerolineales bacterium]